MRSEHQTTLRLQNCPDLITEPAPTIAQTRVRKYEISSSIFLNYDEEVRPFLIDWESRYIPAGNITQKSAVLPLSKRLGA